MNVLKSIGKNAARSVIPLGIRKRLAVWVHRQSWIGPERRAWWSVQLIEDFARKDVNAYHKFLWKYHLGYAAPYEVSMRFGPENMRGSRILFFTELSRCMEEAGIARNRIRSVLEVGCSLGYQLRYLETDWFPESTSLEGIDIDEHAIRSGQEYLRSVGSRISLKSGDVQQLEAHVGRREYDLIICTGVLMYLKEGDAANLVRGMLARSGRILAMAGLAHPAQDNAALERSGVRERDHTFVHNLDGMVRKAGGKIAARRWDGGRLVEGQSVYFVFAAPGDPAH